YLLLYLCLHGAKHPWDTLGQIVDVARLIARFPELDWGVVLAQAKIQRVERMLWLGLLLARDLVGVQLPREVDQRINQDRAVVGLAASTATWLFGGSEGPQNKPQSMIYHFRLQKGIFGKFSYLWRLFAVPTYGDWKMIRLPIALLPIYPLLRPFRLLRKYVWPF
ncbi:MAG: nucleotidyltransferase family protein, partial [Blastocatellia bacterium]